MSRLGKCTVCQGEDGCHASNCPRFEICPKRSDNQHCNCWYDGEKCCACGAPAMTDAEKAEQGMETEQSSEDSSHKQGCPALGGYGTPDRTCICKPHHQGGENG